MDKPTEYQLEKFVLNPDSFSREERNWLMYWIEKDVVLNFLHSYFIDFYAKTKIISKSDPDQAVPKVIELEPDSNNVSDSGLFSLEQPTAIIITVTMLRVDFILYIHHHQKC